MGWALLGLFVLQAGAGLETARSLAAQSKWQEAEEILAKLSNPPAEALHLRGAALHNLGRQADAARVLESALAVDGESPHALNSMRILALSRYVSGDVAGALPWLERVRASGAPGVEVLHMLGNGYITARRYKDACAVFAEMYELAPDSAGAWLITGQMIVRQGREDDAVPVLKRALDRDPKIPEARFLLGQIAIFRGELEEAVSYLKQEIQVNPNFGMAYYRLGDAFARQEKWDAAVPYLQKAIWLNPTYSGPFILLGKVYLRLDQLGNAEGMLRRALQMDPQNASAHYILGQVLSRQGRIEEGRQLMRRSQDLRQPE